MKVAVMSKRKDFPGEVDVNSFHDGTLDTDAGYFDLEYTPHDTDYGGTRVFVDGDHAIVAYQTLDEGTPAPWQIYDGFGKIITKEGDECEWASTLGLNEYGSIEIEGWDDAMRTLALEHAAEEALKQSFRGVEVIKIVPDSQYDFDKGRVDFKVGGVRLRRRYKVEFWQWPTSVGMPPEVVQTLVVTGQGAKIKDNWDFRYEAWVRLRETGEIGDKWAVLLTETHTSFYVTGPWVDTDPEDQYKYRGVWIPDDELIRDIESQKPDKQWARAVELAGQAVTTYCEWANGNCFNVDVEIFQRNTALSEDEDYQWEVVLDASAMHDRDCGGGTYFGSDDANDVMDEDIALAFKVLADLRQVPAS